MEIFKKVISRLSNDNNFLVLLFFVLVSSVLFYQFFVFGKIPAPADVLIGHYHPLKDKIWQGREAGYPIKNFLLFDGIRQTLPWRILAVEQMKQGRIPLWNPYNLGGTPLLANLQTAAFYPLNLLFFIFEKYTAWGLYLFFQPVLAGFFAYLFFKSLNLSFTSCLFGAVSFAFSGMMLNHLEFGIDGHSCLWLPLMLYGVNLIFKNVFKKGFLILLIASVFNLTAGYPPPIVYNFLALTLWAIFKLKESKRPKYYFLTALAVFLAFLITAPQTLSAWELAKKVERRPEFFSEKIGETHFFPYENLLMAIAPDFFGHPSTGNFFSKINYTDSPYIGFWGSSFAILGIFLLFKRKEVFYGALILAATLVLMLPTPLAEFYRKVPIPFISTVSPMRMLWLTGLALALLASFGFDCVFGKEKISLKKIVALFGIGCFLILTCWYFSKIIPHEGQQLITRRNLILPGVIFAVGALCLLFVFVFQKYNNLAKFLFVVLIIGELLRQGLKYNPFVERELIYPQTEILKFLSERPAEEKVLITHQELLPANANIPYRYSMIDGYYSIYDGRVGQLASLANAPIDLTIIGGFPRIVYLSNPSGKIIDLFGIKWVLALEEQRDSKLELVMKEGKTLLYENKKSFPKAFFVKSYFYGEDDLAIARKMLNSDLAQFAVLEKNLGKRIFWEGQAESVSFEEGELKIKTKNEREGLLVIVENYDPGWKAQIDGQEVEILRADYNLMAVIVPPGERFVHFNYQPVSFDLGIKLFFGGILLMIILERSYLNFLGSKYDEKKVEKDN